MNRKVSYRAKRRSQKLQIMKSKTVKETQNQNKTKEK